MDDAALNKTTTQDQLDLLQETSDFHPEHALFVDCLHATKKCLGKHTAYHLCIKICNEEYSQQVNDSVRGKNVPTNVIAIDYQVALPTPVQFLGDLLLCAPIINQEAAMQMALSPADYWRYITLHGILHLFGFDHQTDEQELEMQQHEKACLALCDRRS